MSGDPKHRQCICVECEGDKDARRIVTLIDEKMGRGWTRRLASDLWPLSKINPNLPDAGEKS